MGLTTGLTIALNIINHYSLTTIISKIINHYKPMVKPMGKPMVNSG